MAVGVFSVYIRDNLYKSYISVIFYISLNGQHSKRLWNGSIYWQDYCISLIGWCGLNLTIFPKVASTLLNHFNVTLLMFHVFYNTTVCAGITRFFPLLCSECKVTPAGNSREGGASASADRHSVTASNIRMDPSTRRPSSFHSCSVYSDQSIARRHCEEI